MSIMLKHCEQITKVTANLLRNSAAVSSRQYANIADYKISWVRPEKPSPLIPESSGDQGVQVDLKSTDIYKIYRTSSEMKDAKDIVKRMFTFKFLPRKYTILERREMFADMVKAHDLDETSLEVKIAKLTTDIHMMQDTLKERPRDSGMRATLKLKIDKRKHYLTVLRRKNYRSFEWMLEKMNLIYKPDPSPPQQVSRKDSLRRLTEKYCDKIVQNKLDTYRAELQALKADFYAEKADKLAFIKEEEIACGLKSTVSEEDVALAVQKAKEYQT